MSSQVSVCHSAQEIPMWPLPMMFHCTDPTCPPPLDIRPGIHPSGSAALPSSRHQTWNPSVLLWTSDLGPTPYYWHLVANTRDLLKLVHVRTPPGGDIWWRSLKHVRFVSGRYTFYWNAFLFLIRFMLWLAMNGEELKQSYQELDDCKSKSIDQPHWFSFEN